jgi:hypothetical protein
LRVGHEPAVLFQPGPTEIDPPRTGLAAAVVAVPAAVVPLLLLSFLLLPQAAATEASASTAAMDFHASERLRTSLTFPPCASPLGDDY